MSSDCKGKIVVALGGNALQRKGGDNTAEAQLEVVKQTCRYLARIEYSGYETCIVHGNGPQVGRIMLASETAAAVTPAMPFDVCGAMSQGYIGYHLQLAMKEALHGLGKGYIPVVTLITQVLVDSGDPGFSHPTKPIGKFYTEEEAQALTVEKGYVMKEDAGRGWRRVVASPMPKKILEAETIKRLWDSTILITCGGGGIPCVINEEGNIVGVDAVIDKDYAAELLAEEVDADVLMILTGVEKVCLNYGKPDQEELSSMTVEQALKYVEEGHFAPGSMLPKVESCISFVEKTNSGRALITSLEKAREALKGRTGTLIVK